jgi:hypothetical protein
VVLRGVIILVFTITLVYHKVLSFSRCVLYQLQLALMLFPSPRSVESRKPHGEEKSIGMHLQEESDGRPCLYQINANEMLLYRLTEMLEGCFVF